MSDILEWYPAQAALLMFYNKGLLSCFLAFDGKVELGFLPMRRGGRIQAEIKKGILGIKLKDQSFNNHHGNYRTFLQEFEAGMHNIDKDWLLVEALA